METFLSPPERPVVTR